jgi:hypothetical protein
MSSIWTDLLLLHGHALPAQLVWRPNDGLDSRSVDAALKRAKPKPQPNAKPVVSPARDCGKAACA